MSIQQVLVAFFSDLKLQAAVALIVVDFIVGVAAALKAGKFNLSYIAAFAKDDVAFKLLPWLAVYVGAKYAGHQQIVIPGFDLNVIAMSVYVAVVTAWTASISASLAELGFGREAAVAIHAGSEHPGSPPPPTPVAS
jgi:hypothetical protein